MNANIKPIAGLHLVRYGTAADQKYLLGDLRDSYDQIIFNASIVAHMPDAIASFIGERAKKPYFIDPQTHGFQHDVSHLLSVSETREGEIKRSVRRLLEEYGEPVQLRVGDSHESVLPEDFEDDRLRKAFCRRVLEFQLNSIEKRTQESDAAKYYKYLKGKGKAVATNLRPSLLVAPYFYMTSSTLNRWLPVNVACARESQEYTEKQNIPLAVQIVISRDLLEGRKLRPVVTEYENSGVKPVVFLVWVDSFSELQASEDELRTFVEFLRQLGTLADIVNLYGGFFSLALSRCGLVKPLVGVCHGLEYGEDRGVLPVGGGIPVAKYYLPALHARLRFREALRAVRALQGLKSVDDFLSRICECEECRRVIRSDPVVDFREYLMTCRKRSLKDGREREYPLPETKEHCVRHYMWCKAREYRDPLSPGGIIQELRQTENRLNRILGLQTVSHCEAWARVLSG